MSTTKKPRKNAKQATFDRQVFHVRRLLREFGAVETKPPGRFTGELAKLFIDGDEWTLPTAYGPAYVTCYASLRDGSLWVAIGMQWHRLTTKFKVHHTQNLHFDKDNSPEEVEGAIFFKLNWLCNRQAIHGTVKPTIGELAEAEAAYSKAEADRKAAGAAFYAERVAQQTKAAE